MTAAAKEILVHEGSGTGLPFVAAIFTIKQLAVIKVQPKYDGIIVKIIECARLAA